MNTADKKVLIIDNEKEFSALIKSFLEESINCEVRVVPDGYNGIRIAEEIRPGLILLDVLMPAMNGFDILKKLKENEGTRSIPVIMTTAVDDDRAKKKAQALNCAGYLVKPLKLEELRYKVKEILKV